MNSQEEKKFSNMGFNACIFFIVVLFFVLLISVFVIVIVIAITMSRYPRFYIQEIYIPSLNNPNSYNATNLNNSIIIDLKIKKVVPSVACIPLLYKDINLTLFYGSNRSSGAVGRAVVPGFLQGRRKMARRRVVVEARALPWEDAFEKISGGSTVALTAELAANYVPCDDDGSNCFHDEAMTVVVAADLEVDASGADVSKKPIRLYS